jgi:hypothetical protein
VRYKLGLYVPEDDILHSHHCENLKSYIALTSWALKQKHNMFLEGMSWVFYIPKDDILHSHCCENLKSYKTVCAWNNAMHVGGIFCDFMKYLLSNINCYNFRYSLTVAEEKR